MAAAAAQVKQQIQQQQMLKQFLAKSQHQPQHSQAANAVAAAAMASIVNASSRPRASPIPPALNLQPGQANPSPRCLSPLLQAPLSPRAPSPISESRF